MILGILHGKVKSVILLYGWSHFVQLVNLFVKISLSLRLDLYSFLAGLINSKLVIKQFLSSLPEVLDSL